MTGIAEYGKIDSYQVRASADLRDAAVRYKIVTFAGAICSAALVRQAAGILWSAPNSGSDANVVYQGRAKAVFGGGISTAGFPLSVANSGFLVACVSGGLSVGRAIGLVNSGDTASCFVDFKNISPQAIL